MSEFPTIPGYRVLSLLGSGSFADVFLAEDVSVERRVAIKLLRERTPSASQLDRFRRERETLAGLNHPHLLRVHAAGSVGGRPYVVTELLQGKTLDDLLRETKDRDHLLDLMHQAAVGVAALHAAGLVHRDVKPENLLLDEEGKIKVADLGLVSGDDLRSLTTDGALIGTPAYMAPEMCTGRGTRDPACDVYSLGATLYEILTGEIPHPAPTIASLLLMRLALPNPDPRLLVPDLPVPLAAICMRAMEGIPQDRYPDAAAFADALLAATRSRVEERERSLFPLMVILVGLIVLLWALGWSPDSPATTASISPTPTLTPTRGDPRSSALPDDPTPASDLEALYSELLGGGPESISRAEEWITANSGRVEAAARLRDAARAGILNRPATRSLSFKQQNPKHAPVALPTAEGVLWFEFCNEYCRGGHSSPSRMQLIGPEAVPQELDWDGHHVTGHDPSGRFWAVMTDGGEHFLYQRFGTQFDKVLTLSGRCTALASQGDAVVCGFEDGRVLRPTLRRGQPTWEQQVHRGRVVALSWSETRLVSLAASPRPFVVLNPESGETLAPQFQLPTLGALRWGVRLERPEEYLLCVNGLNVLHGVRPDAANLRFVGEKRLNENRPSGQAFPWSPDGTTPRGAVRLGGLLISVGSQRFEKQRDSQLRIFDRRTGVEVVALLDTRLDYCSIAVQAEPSRVLIAGCAGPDRARLKVWEFPAALQVH